MSTLQPTYKEQLNINENIDGYHIEKPQKQDVLEDQEFGFFDFLDMINPLQHIPLVNIAYRAITNDSIKPISEIIGGAVFGGAAGAASGLINTVVREETGKDIVGNILSFTHITGEETSKNTISMNPIERTAYKDLPASLLAFAKTPIPDQDEKTIKHN